MKLINTDVVLKDIEDLRKSPWYNAKFLSDERRLGMKEGMDMVRDACIQHSETVNAIPVEWIDQFVEKHRGYISRVTITWLLDDWRAEQRRQNEE